jgi:hypothetical protein
LYKYIIAGVTKKNVGNAKIGNAAFLGELNDLPHFFGGQQRAFVEGGFDLGRAGFDWGFSADARVHSGAKDH